MEVFWLKNRLVAGVGRRVITPPMGLPMAGFAARQVGCTGVHDDLYAKALLLANGRSTVVLLCLDILWINQLLTEAIRDDITDETGIPGDNIMICTSHNHSGPDLDDPKCSSWLPNFRDQVVGAVVDAWQSKTEALVGVGSTHVHGIGVNRRGKNIVDSSVGVIKVERGGAYPDAVVVNYTCHAVVLGPDNLLISADYPGYAQRGIETALRKKETVALFTNGAAGDINTGHSPDACGIGAFTPGRTYERAEELGTRLADVVLTALPGIQTRDEIELGAVRVDWAADYRTDLGTEEEIMTRIMQLEEFIANKYGEHDEEWTQASIELMYKRDVLGNVKEANAAKCHRRVTEIQAIRIDDAVLVALPGEVFVQLGLVIKEASPFPFTFVAGYANDNLGYMPTAEAFTEGGYEVTTAKFAKETGAQLVQVAGQCLQRLI
jgi:hypothetical protein